MPRFEFFDPPRDRADAAFARLALRLEKLREVAVKHNFNPAEAQIPAGNPGGGRWMRIGGGFGDGYARVAFNDGGHGATTTDAGSFSRIPLISSNIPPHTNIDDNIVQAGNHKLGNPLSELQNYLWFYSRVNDSGPWDYKLIDPKYRDFGNFNYGATGKAMGISEATLLRMAGVVQVRDKYSRPDWGKPVNIFQALLGIGGKPPFGDDPRDQEWIKRGFRYYDNYAAKRLR